MNVVSSQTPIVTSSDSLATFLYFWGTGGILLTHFRVLNILKHIYMAEMLIIYWKGWKDVRTD